MLCQPNIFFFFFDRRQNELRHFALKGLFDVLLTSKEENIAFPPPSPSCNLVPMFELSLENNKRPNFEWRRQGRSVDSYVVWSYPIWVQCLNNFVADCGRNRDIFHRPFQGFFNFWLGPTGENPLTRLKVPLTISQVAKFKRNLLKTSEDIATQTHRVSQRFVWWGVSLCPSPDIRLENFATLWTNIFARFGRIWERLGTEYTLSR